MKAPRFLLVLPAFILLSCLPLRAQTAGEIAEKFIEFNLSSETLSIMARLYIPESYDPEKNYPLVVTLHGAGEVGTDNYNQILYNGLATSWGKDEFQAGHPCFIFSPQCPTGSTWGTERVHQSVMILIDSLISLYSVDTTRIYLTGLSLGGNGTWTYLVAHPDLFAAAVPNCGWMNNSSLKKSSFELINHIPVWNFHGNLDNVVSVESSRAIMKYYDQLNRHPVLTHNYYRLSFGLSPDSVLYYINNQADLLYSEVPNTGHDVWNVSYYNPSVKEWLFKQRKREKGIISLQKTGALVEVTGNHDIHFTVSEKAASIGVCFGHADSAIMYPVDTLPAVSGAYTFSSTEFEDNPYARLKFLAFDEEGFVIGTDYSDTLRINNPGNAAPYVALVNDRFIMYNTSVPEYTMEIRLADPESDPLRVKIMYSLDNGQSFDVISEIENVSTDHLEETLIFSDLYYAEEMVIRVEASDGEYTSAVQTLDFENKYGFINSIPDFSQDKFTVYPVPAGEYIDIAFDAELVSEFELQLFSPDSREIAIHNRVQPAPGRRVLRIPVSHLLPGVYILRLNTSNGELGTRKIIVR